jgi:hypothetical protein
MAIGIVAVAALIIAPSSKASAELPCVTIYAVPPVLLGETYVCPSI